MDFCLKVTNLCLTGLLLLSSYALAQESDCSAGIGQCLSAYSADMAMHLKLNDQDIICQDANNFLRCSLSLECTGGQVAMRDKVIEAFEDALEQSGYFCDLNVEDVNSNPETFPKPPNPPEGEEGTCQKGISACTQAYVTNTLDAEKSNSGDDRASWFCPVISEYMMCVAKAECETDPMSKNVQQRIYDDLSKNGIECENIEIETETVEIVEETDQAEVEASYSLEDSACTAHVSFVFVLLSIICQFLLKSL